ncbi:NfeD family protein [Leptothoe spongobia]|uniref:NfeD family protein n=1 Tax=Leptothoe spongobia TAU-MAC 1115 TaxID=1967444 RepID=A0A947DBI7_9CYAN|nr:NfeD family protein [Leptothoe spongobia]MBT9314123.1 NfeD family protein [Leptothoe spongobia TAU-MAC 1115]
MSVSNPENENLVPDPENVRLFPGSDSAREARVTQRLEPGKIGRVSYQATFWPAKLFDGNAAVEKGAIVQVVGRDNGLTLLVQPIEEPKTDSFPLVYPDGRVSTVKITNKKAQSDSQATELALSIEADETVLVDEIAAELAILCKALNAYHIACGGNGLEIDDWETLVAVRELAEV